MAQQIRSAQVNRSGYQTRSEVKRKMRPAIPRDDLRKAFAGMENNGPAGEE